MALVARHARADDLAGCVACAASFTTYEPNPVSVAACFDETLAAGTLFVAEQDGEIIGFLAAQLGPHAFTGRDFVSVIAWWVPEDYRGQGAGIALLRCFLRWCSTQQLDMVTISAPLSSRLSTLLRAFGFAPVEVVHMRGHTWDVKGAGCQARRSRRSRRT